MRTATVAFENERGEKLSGRLETPGCEPRAFALFAHCFTCDMTSKAAVFVSRALAERGVAVLRFDFTGLGESEGEFARTGFASNVRDLVAAARFLEAEHEGPALHVGHSLGGAAVIAAARDVPSARAVATIGAPADPAEVLRHIPEEARERIEREGAAPVRIGGRPFTLGRELIRDLEEGAFARTIREIGRPLLVLHAPGDAIVPIDAARRIFEAARHPKSFVSLDDADHLLTNREHGRYVGEVIAAWASRYVAPVGTDSAGAGAGRDAGPGTGTGSGGSDVRPVVTRTGDVDYQTSICVGPHAFFADEPKAAGGADTGPSPYDLHAAALGACTSMTLKMYARRKGWPLEDVLVRLEHAKVHAEDCADCETKEGKVDRIDRELRLRGPLDDEQRRRLLEIADRCPVHRTLSSEVWVRTRLAD